MRTALSRRARQAAVGDQVRADVEHRLDRELKAALGLEVDVLVGNETIPADSNQRLSRRAFSRSVDRR
jgi:hypothetical protein